MKKFFESRQKARDFAKVENLKVCDAGTTAPKGQRWFVELSETSEKVSEIVQAVSIKTQVVKKQQTLSLKKSKTTVKVNSFSDLGWSVKPKHNSNQLYQNNKGRKHAVNVQVKRSVKYLMVNI